MSLINKVFPPTASNDYRGSRIAFWTLCLFAVQFTFRSLVHHFKDDSGVNSIASIITFAGTPDPDTVIYLYSSLWGGAQILLTLIIFVVLWRYRNLIPLMFLIIALDMVFRMTAGAMHPLTPEHYEHAPPGSYINIPFLVIALVMFGLSLHERKPPKSPADAKASQTK